MLRPGIEPVISFTGARDYARSAVASWTGEHDCGLGPALWWKGLCLEDGEDDLIRWRLLSVVDGD